MTYTFTLALQGELYAFRTQPQERLEELSRAIQQLIQDHFRNVSLDAPVAINVGAVEVRPASLQLSPSSQPIIMLVPQRQCEASLPTHRGPLALGLRQRGK